MSDCITTIACCHEGCGHVISFKTEVERRLRRTHEWWQCPAGHQQHFSGPTAQEREISTLKADLAQTERDINYWRRAALVCPFPTCQSYEYANPRTLRRHLTKAHEVNLAERLAEATEQYWDEMEARWQAGREARAEANA